jgi:hypothetical protein
MLRNPVLQLDNIHLANCIREFLVGGAWLVTYEVLYWFRETVDYIL